MPKPTRPSTSRAIDTAHKLAHPDAPAFGTEIDVDSIYLEGISSITQADIEAADELGYKIKLLGVARRTESGIEQRVHPTMVPHDTAIAGVDGVLNAVAVDGDFVGEIMLVGPGAGGPATASSVVGDIARHRARHGACRRSACPPRACSHTSARGCGRTKAATTSGCRSTIGRAPSRRSPRAWPSRSISLESIVQKRPRAAASDR